jgi:hypothetical protein
MFVLCVLCASLHGLAILNMGFGCLCRVLVGVFLVTAGQVGVMGRGFVSAGLVMLRRFLMMSRGVLIVFGCPMMMVCCLFRHYLSSQVMNGLLQRTILGIIRPS